MFCAHNNLCGSFFKLFFLEKESIYSNVHPHVARI